MVGNITSLTGKGLRDWLIQRVSAVVLLVYGIVLAVLWGITPEITYDQWHLFFACPLVKAMNALVWLLLVMHAWIGLWTVTTDYLKSFGVRLVVQMLIALTLLGLFFFGILIFWGV